MLGKNLTVCVGVSLDMNEYQFAFKSCNYIIFNIS